MNVNNLKFYINNGIGILLSNTQSTQSHAHHAIQIGIIINGDYEIIIDDKVIDYSILINSNVSHCHSSCNGSLLSIFIEPESYIGRRLKQKYSSDFHRFCYDKKTLAHFLQCSFTEKPSHNTIETCLYKLLKLEELDIELNSITEMIINRIETNNIENLTVSHILSGINKSDSYARHVFKQQTGISLKKYLLWYKIRKSLNSLKSGDNITEAAYISGFSDSAHLTRSFKEMFGINPTRFLQDSQSVQSLEF